MFKISNIDTASWANAATTYSGGFRGQFRHPSGTPTLQIL